MRYVVVLSLVAALACGKEAAGPAPAPSLFVGGGIISLTWTSNGCEVLWHAKANDPSVVVTYEVGYENWERGTFQDSVRVRFIPDPGPVMVDPLRLRWTFTVGAYTSSSGTDIRQDVGDCHA